MAEGDGVADRDERAIRVRLDETASEGDLDALRKWLEREQPLDEMVREGRLRIHERARTDETGAPMGVGMEIVIQLIGAAGGAVFLQLLNQVGRSVDAWRANRRQVEDGEPPTGTVDPLDGDG
ncbi:hypothetical protein QQY66_24945 [Streptomyces sp. DG2A-72]|uniref:hypothetical protein n=1 Tax=Streptomyces sp. DG2A-72 TaxID=3051386 RepID=UPI00265C61EC|nr:hypothetical protein [Streptomyces sp. DG2A-72]MDO0934769.1 hypothetical protein [Streptomyces sp. DG2A-72]